MFDVLVMYYSFDLNLHNYDFDNIIETM